MTSADPRTQRLERALRANLARRKARARDEAMSGAPETPEPTPPTEPLQ